MPDSRPLARILLACGLGALLTVPVRAQEPVKPTTSATEANPAVPAPGHSTHGEAFNDGPRRAGKLIPGMGKAHFAASTKKAEAQAFIDQGVAQLHSFYYYEAERSFRQAAKIDPNCAIAYWGMAMSNTSNAKRGRGFIEQARKRASGATRREQLYIESLEAYFRENSDAKSRRQGYLAKLEAVVHEFPEDLDARAWLVMVTWSNAMDGIGSRQAVDMVLDGVLQAEPMHPGAHHYRIHLWDGVDQNRALKSAGLYAKSALGIAHAWHMPGHTYTGLKRYADAAYQQEGSARVDHAAMFRDHTMPFEIHNYAHNNQWLCTTYSHLGRVRDAIAVARNLVEQPRDPDKNGPRDGGSSQRSGRIRWAEVLSRYELWDDLIEADRSGVLDWSNLPVEQVQKAYMLGQAYAAKSDAKHLEEQIGKLRGLLAEETKAASSPPAGQAARTRQRGTGATASALAELEGWRKLLTNDIGGAFEEFGHATAMRKDALARAHLKARNYGLAESTARRGASEAENQLAPLATLVEVLHEAGKEPEAKQEYRKLEVVGRWADRDLPILQRLEKVAASWRSGKSWPGSNPAAPNTGTEETTVDRIDLTTLGPLLWSPFPADSFTLAETSGAPWRLEAQRGRYVLVLFFLGNKCAHCMQQLQVFSKASSEFAKRKVAMVAVSTDDPIESRKLKENQEGVVFTMPILADPALKVFKQYHAFDDFEDQPLHGTFLIDPEGNVRYQRISAEPFLDVDFVKGEIDRLERMAKQKRP